MKVTIEIPDGQVVPNDEMIQRLTDPNWLAIWWSVRDVQGQAESLGFELIEDEKIGVLEKIEYFYDEEKGVNYEMIKKYIQAQINQREFSYEEMIDKLIADDINTIMSNPTNTEYLSNILRCGAGYDDWSETEISIKFNERTWEKE